MLLNVVQDIQYFPIGGLNPYAAGGYFALYKMMQKSWKMTETLAHEYSSKSAQLELSNEYQHDRFKMLFQNRCIL